MKNYGRKRRHPVHPSASVFARGGADVAETLFHFAFSASPRGNLDGRVKPGHDEEGE